MFVGDRIFTGGRGIATATGGNFGGENLNTLGVENPRPLLGEADLDVAFLVQWILTEKQPHHSHVAAARGEIDRPKRGGARVDAGCGPRLDEIPSGLDVAGIGCQHEGRDVAVHLQNPAHHARPDLAEEGRGARESKGGIGIRAGGEKLPEGARAFGGDGEVKGGLAFRQAEVGVCTMQDQLLGHPVMAGGKGE